MTKLDTDITRMKQAYAEASQSNCVKHKVGVVITDKLGRLVGSGYNGSPEGHTNCCDHFKGWDEQVGAYEETMPMRSSERALEKLYDAHHEWANAHEVHAEINALMYSNRDDRLGGTMYCTLEPCRDCAKAIAASGIGRVVYSEGYHRTVSSSVNLILYSSGIEVVKLDGCSKV